MPLPSNLAAYWPLNESVSGSYADLTGTNNGTGTTTPVTGQVNGAQQFNGTTDKIKVPPIRLLISQPDDFSVEFWFKIDAVSSNYKVAVRRHITCIYSLVCRYTL